MKSVQYISISKQMSGFDSHALTNPEAFDKYKINIIDLNGPDPWSYSIYGLEHKKELNYLAQLFTTSSKNKTLIILPQNIIYSGSGSTIDNIKEDVVEVVSKFISPCFSLKRENNSVSIYGNLFKASFYFCLYGKNTNPLIEAEKTDRTLAFRSGNCVVTTLNIKSEDEINTILKATGLISGEINMPKWLENYEFFNEAEIKSKIIESRNTINDLEHDIKEKENILNQYSKYKRLLSESGDELVTLVKDVLQEILGADFSCFIDDKKEDLRFNNGDDVYLIEIKGTNKNVMRSNITQISSRRDEYVEELELKNIKPILIINDQRMTPIKERLNVSDEQIHLANIYHTLIIRTESLLKLLEQYRSKKISKNDFLIILKEKEGLLLTD